jgi:hypothetical protein
MVTAHPILGRVGSGSGFAELAILPLPIILRGIVAWSQTTPMSSCHQARDRRLSR